MTASASARRNREGEKKAPHVYTPWRKDACLSFPTSAGGHLCLAEAEFDSAAAADALTIPSFLQAEVTTNDRFTGGQLVRASRQEIQIWLAE
jgi:hypothetical protein